MHSNSRAPLSVRLLRRVKKTKTCWLWVGATNGHGYGSMNRKDGGKERATHRIAWTIFFGPIPKGKWVLHRCDVRNCCNPSHLFLGTRADNIKDAVTKGRMACGSRSGVAKVKEADIVVIRKRAASGESQQSIAADFGIHQMNVSRIVRRKIWRHVV